MIMSTGNKGEAMEMEHAGSGTGAGSETVVLKKGPWTPEEDAILMDYINKKGHCNWNAVQKNSGLPRCAKSCRLRWANHLRPDIKKGSFTPEEETIIVKMHAKHGNKWARMAAKLPGRTDNDIKNFWHTRTKRRMKQGLPLYPEGIEGKQSPASAYELSSNTNTSTTDNDSLCSSRVITPNTNTSPLSPPTPTSHPHLPSLPSHNHSHSLNLNLSSPTTLLQTSPTTYQSTLSLIDPSNITFIPARSPPILSSPFGRFKRFRSSSATTTTPAFSLPVPVLAPTPLLSATSPLLLRSSPIATPLSPTFTLSSTTSSPIVQTHQPPPPPPFSFNPDLIPTHLSPTHGISSQHDATGFKLQDFPPGPLSSPTPPNPMSTTPLKMQLPSTQISQTPGPNSTAIKMDFPSSSKQLSTSPSPTLDHHTKPTTTHKNKTSGNKRALPGTSSQDAYPLQVDAEEKTAATVNMSKQYTLLGQSLSAGDLLSESSKTEFAFHEAFASKSFETNGLLGKSMSEEERCAFKQKWQLQAVDSLGESCGRSEEGLWGQCLSLEDFFASPQRKPQLEGIDDRILVQTATTAQIESEQRCVELNSADSSADDKAKERIREEQINMMSEELSSLLEFFPSTMQVPEWYRIAQEIPNHPSPGEVDANLSLEMQLMGQLA